MSWWDADPIDIQPMDRHGMWVRHPLPPFMYGSTDEAVADYDQIADACARLFGRTATWSSSGLWVRMVGPLEYVRTAVMPVELNERVARAVGSYEREDAYRLGEEFDVLDRYVPKGVRFSRTGDEIMRLIAKSLSVKLAAVPRPRTASEPVTRSPIRSDGPPKRLPKSA